MDKRKLLKKLPRKKIEISDEGVKKCPTCDSDLIQEDFQPKGYLGTCHKCNKVFLK